MSKEEKLSNQQQVLAKLQQQLRIDKVQKRKQDTRLKIEFGGLVIKSKMDNYSKSVILGALIDAKECMRYDGSVEKLYPQRAKKHFWQVVS